MVEPLPALPNILLSVANALIVLAIKLAIRPMLIITIGAIPPAIPTTLVIKDFTPLSSSLNLLRTLVPNSINGVTKLIKISPMGAIAPLNSSTAPLNLYRGESSTRLSSLSASTPSSAVVALVSSSTRLAWLPSAITFWKRVESLAN